MAEHLHLASEAVKKGQPPTASCCYITLGTGIGVGLVINNQTVHGLMHPEGGHLAVPRHADDANFAGNNPKDCFGGLCAENMACSASLAARAGLKSTSGLASLPDDHHVWDVAAYYLGALCANIVLLASPERIIISGGVLQRASLFPKIRKEMQKHLNGYIQMDAITTSAGVKHFVAPSTWGNQAGMIGALTLAKKALDAKKRDDARYYLPMIVAAGAVAAVLAMRR